MDMGNMTVQDREALGWLLDLDTGRYYWAAGSAGNGGGGGDDGGDSFWSQTGTDEITYSGVIKVKDAVATG